jgi:pyruvate kinase
MARRTKIIATLGPASEFESTLADMMRLGADVIRLGAAHGSLEQNLDRYHFVRRVASEADRPIGVLVDLPGPKVRAGRFPEDGVVLVDGATVRIEPGSSASTGEVVEVDYDRIAVDTQIGDPLVFGDGSVLLEVVGKGPSGLEATVLHGGLLRGRPGVHVPSDRLRMTTPTPQDLRILDAFVDVGVDMVALSFVRSAHDVRRSAPNPILTAPWWWPRSRRVPRSRTWRASSRRPAPSWWRVGDLGAECPIEELPHLQKKIIRTCIAYGRPAITATQMLESMVEAPSPTRAEASDVANAIFDGSSALMLSGRPRWDGTRSAPWPPWPESPSGPTSCSTTRAGPTDSHSCTTRAIRAPAGPSPTP